MNQTIFIFLLLSISGCKPVMLTSGINDHEAYHLYLQSVKNNEDYIIRYNPDSTYALCILNDMSDLVSEPITFFIVDIFDRGKVLVSINEYHKADWIDDRNVLLTSYFGTPNFSDNFNIKPGGNFKELIFNVISKQIQLHEPEIEN